jgi:glycerol 2-dehydrogenase (NADP+)
MCFAVSSGRSVLAKSVKPDRIAENLKLVHLDQPDLDEIAAFIAELKDQNKVTRYVYPAFGVDFGFPDKSDGNNLSRELFVI